MKRSTGLTLVTVSIALAAILTGPSGSAQVVGHDLAEATPFIGSVDQPDVVGGFASTHIIVQVQPDTQPVTLEDDRLSFHNEALEPAVAVEIEADIANTLDRWQAQEIAPTMQFEPANPDLATEIGIDRYFTITVAEATDTRAMAEELSNFHLHFASAQADGIGGILSLPNDPDFNQQYGLHNTGQTIGGQTGTPGADIDALAAWELHTGTDDIIIAVVDTGIGTGHPEFSGKLVTGYNSMDGSSNVNDSTIIPHGTHVSGIAAAATDNGIGIAGVSWGAMIMPIKSLNLFGGGTETDIANGVIWAADNGADIINMSLGVPDGIAFFEDACQYAFDSGLLLVAASGNTPGAAIPWPAAWPTVMAVGATDNQDNLASFTTTGPEMSVSAPGVDVYSTWLGLFGGSTYSFQSGTSMAAPHVAGLAALAWSADLDLTNHDIWQIIEDTADDKGTPGWNPQFGHGRINAYNAVSHVLHKDDCPFADLNCDGEVNVLDLLILLENWGDCPDPEDCPADLKKNGAVGVLDLLLLLENWG